MRGHINLRHHVKWSTYNILTNGKITAAQRLLQVIAFIKQQQQHQYNEKKTLAFNTVFTTFIITNYCNKQLLFFFNLVL